MTITLAAYEKKALSTAVDADQVARVLTPEVTGILKRFVELARSIDNYKKAMFYGRDIELYPEPSTPMPRGGVNNDTIHGIFGIAGEAGELVEVLLSGFNGVDIKDAVKDEQGDLLWYNVMLSRGNDVPLGQVLEGNIEKLEKRWAKAKAEGKTDFKEEGSTT